MKRNNYNGVVYYTFGNLAKKNKIKHLFSTRIGGVSEGKFKSMNLSFGTGDDRESVSENFRKISEIGFPIEKMVFSNQVHEDKIATVHGDDCGKGILRESDIIGADGLMTNTPGVVLVTFYADCVPLYFYDPIKSVIALSHSGWRGTFLEIGKKTVLKMTEQFGSRPEDIFVGIGPSICKKCFEAGTDVAEKFAEKPGNLSQFIIKSTTAADKYFIDLWGINKQILIAASVPEQNIELPDLCTKCNPDIFFSHRAMGNNRGSMAAFLGIV